MFKYLTYTVIAMAIIYGIILSYPGLFFDNNYEYKNFKVYTHEAVEGNIEGVLDKVYEKISKTEFFNPDFKYRFYIVKDVGQYSFLTAFQGEGYSYVSPLGNIFLVSADFKKNKTNCKNCGEESIRDLDIIMTSAATWDIIRQSLKALKYIVTSNWKLIGYGEYVAGETGYFEPSEICKSKTDKVWPELYKYHLVMQMLMIKDRYPFSVVLEKHFSYEGVEKRLKKRHCR